ncbi:vitellogenin-like [Quillaja saponaria]|uniref:Vitellogenin-like n=1 Tax=Quillaja saponaria TaxID=32244 RepID=A0AAD7PN17_QUISA|nr:vitellogenin-like [Quillaja saponaria]
MRCKKHLPDLSSTVGVCATCLRERLSIIIAAQAKAQQAYQQAQIARALSRASTVSDDSRKSDINQPPPLLFPRSVSPYVSRRKSDEATCQTHNRLDHRFYSTPQLGPTYSTTVGNSAYDSNTTGTFRKKQGKFSIFTNFFRSRSEKFESDPRVSVRDLYEPSSSSSSTSWFTALFSSRRKKKSPLFSTDESTIKCPRTRRQADRGMSPAEPVEFNAGLDGYNRSPSGNGLSSETSPKWRKTPLVPPPSARRSGRNVSGMGFCLSPLVRNESELELEPQEHAAGFDCI